MARRLRIIFPAPGPFAGLADALGRRVRGRLVLGLLTQRAFRLGPQGNSEDSGHPIGGGKDVMLENKRDEIVTNIVLSQ
jgi:hypothetical protein